MSLILISSLFLGAKSCTALSKPSQNFSEEISKSFSNASKYIPLEEKQKLSIIQAILSISENGVKFPRKEALSKENIINLTKILRNYLNQVNDIS